MIVRLHTPTGISRLTVKDAGALADLRHAIHLHCDVRTAGTPVIQASHTLLKRCKNAFNTPETRSKHLPHS